MRNVQGDRLENIHLTRMKCLIMVSENRIMFRVQRMVVYMWKLL